MFVVQLTEAKTKVVMDRYQLANAAVKKKTVFYLTLGHSIAFSFAMGRWPSKAGNQNDYILSMNDLNLNSIP